MELVQMKSELSTSTEYKDWLKELKQRVLQVQLKAAVAVNTELLEFYWELGSEIVEKQKGSVWGSGFIKRLSADLMSEFPEIKGFSKRNLELIRKWYLFYNQSCLIAKQAVSQLENSIESDCESISTSSQRTTSSFQNTLYKIPWGHNIVIIQKCKDLEEALYYVNSTIEYGWSRSVLTHQIENGLWQREGTAITNFTATLTKPQSDLAQQTLKDPYKFDFLSMTKEYNERDLELGLIEHITSFLLELGAGFAYIGRQYPLKVGEREFIVDLLFYHTKLHCYVVVELKTVEFEPEHAGKLNFYIKAVDSQLKTEHDQPTIGILLCKNKDKIVAEYALSDINKPIGISEYQLTQSLPETLKPSLPSIEEIEAELEQNE